MQDFNDLFYFAMVVEHGGFAQAGRALNVPKSKLSRRIALLEAQLGVRLIQRSSRQFSVTELGRLFLDHCKAMIAQADAARALVDLTRSEPCGLLRITCSNDLLQGGVSRMVADYIAINTKVSVYLKVYNRPIDIIAEGFDIAIRESSGQLNDSELIQRVLARRECVLVAHPDLLKDRAHPVGPADVAAFATLELGSPRTTHEWSFEHADGAVATIRHQPRMVTDDVACIYHAALGAAGVAILPRTMVADDLQAGRLVELLPGWAAPGHVVHALLPSRRHLLPSVRSLVDHLVACFQAPALAAVSPHDTERSGQTAVGHDAARHMAGKAHAP